MSYSSIGPTSNSVFLRHIKKAILGYSSEVPTCRQDRHGLVNVSDVSRPSSPRLQSRWYSESNFPPQLPRNAYDLPPRWKIIGLVNAFFDRPGMLFPYTYKKCILDGLEHGKDASLHSVRRSWLCLLNTIMAFSTILGDSSRNSIETSFTEADAFLQRALKLLPDLAVETANFETCQFSRSPSHAKCSFTNDHSSASFASDDSMRTRFAPFISDLVSTEIGRTSCVSDWDTRPIAARRIQSPRARTSEKGLVYVFYFG